MSKATAGLYLCSFNGSSDMVVLWRIIQYVLRNRAFQEMELRDQSIAVVMSSYNGASYITEQLDSVLTQNIPNLSVIVRDDGSTDGTVQILQQYARRGDIRLICGENEGYVKSFFDVLAAAGDFDYYCFADQDDIWLPDKVSSAIELIQESSASGPVLYCSELLYCDERCENPRRSNLNLVGLDGQKMVYEDICSGNTMVFNREMKELATMGGSKDVFAHDWWFGLVACSLGTLVWDENPHLLYRRNGNNASPSGMSSLRLAKYRVAKIFGNGKLPRIRQQIVRFYSLYGDRLDTQLREIVRVAAEGNRFQKAFASGRYRQKRGDEALLRLTLLAGLL